MTHHNQGIVLLAIRGQLSTKVLDEARAIHNETAGAPQGVAAARSLGDLSHNVYVPLADAPEVASELLILDRWNDPDGLQKFFSDPQVQAGGDRIFTSRDPVVWQAAEMRGFALPAPHGNHQRYIGMVRGTVKSRALATEVLDEVERKTINIARKHGQVSRQMFWRVVPPGQPESLELIGIDEWTDADGMRAYYEGGHVAPVFDVFSEPAVASTWKQPAGSWVEW